MVSRERLLSLGAKAAERATTKRVRVAGQVLLFAGVVFVVLRVQSLWHGSHIELDRVTWPALAGATAADAAAIVAAAFVWLHILRQLGLEPQRRWTGIYMQAQLGKYIPGSVWQYAGRAALARAESVPFRLAAVSLSVELGGSVTAAVLVASVIGGTFAFAVGAGAAATTLVLWAFAQRRFAPLRRAPTRATFYATLLYVPIWLLLGLCFWLTARALFSVSFDEVGYYTGAFTVAWLVGLIAVFAPGGIGVREAVLVALIHSRTGASDAVLLATVSRGLLTAVDLLAGAVSVLVLRGVGPRRPVDPQAEDQSTRWAKTTNPVP